jgi:hypothetical protein
LKYTKEIHAHMLLLMLDEDEPCKPGRCPACQYNLMKGFMPGTQQPKICRVCRKFINHSHVFLEKGLKGNCPCWGLGGKEALKRTYLALEEKGYI